MNSEKAQEPLDPSWIYTMAIPRCEVRLRLACMWPILFAGGTLRDVARSADPLNPAVHVKISKGEVDGTMALTSLSLGCSYVATALWGHLRSFVP